MAKKRQRYTPWEINEFSGGKIDKADDNLIPDNAAKDCQNFIATRIGSLSKRKGQVRLSLTNLSGIIQGIHAFYYGTSRRLVVVANGSAYSWDGTAFSAAIKTGLNASAVVLFETCVNYMVAMNGVDVPWKWDGTSVTALANAPAKGRFPILHKEKLFCVNDDNPSTLIWSGSFAPEDWPAVNYWDIRKGDGDKITGQIQFLGELFIFKRRSIHTLKGSSLDNFQLAEIDSRVGCVGPRALGRYGLQLYFISDDGLYTTNGLKTVNLSEAKIPDTWATINKEHLHKAVVGVWNDLIRFELPEGTSTYNNYSIWFDPATQAFWPMRGINASCYELFNDGTKIILYSGNSNAGYVDKQDTGTDDFGSAIYAFWKGKFYDAGMPEVQKKGRKAYVQDSPNTENVTTLSLNLDYGTSYNSLSFNRSEGYIREYLFALEANRWRYLSPMVAHESAGACEVRGIAIPYKPKAMMGLRGI